MEWDGELSDVFTDSIKNSYVKFYIFAVKVLFSSHLNNIALKNEKTRNITNIFLEI